ncbi:hypothetical protein N8D36_08870 [Enterococcus faecium]
MTKKRGSATYGESLLNKAIADTNSVYNPKRKSDFKIFIKDQEQPKEEKYYSYDDTGNADRFTDIYGTLVKYSYIDKSWYYYDGKVWLQDNTGEVRKMIDTTVDIMGKEPLTIPEGADDETKEALMKAKEKTRQAFSQQCRKKRYDGRIETSTIRIAGRVRQR